MDLRIMSINIWGDYFGNEVETRAGGLISSVKAACPDVLGLHMLQAADVLHDNSLNVGRMVFDRDIRDYNDSLNAVVWRQSPDIGPGQVRLGEGGVPAQDDR